MKRYPVGFGRTERALVLVHRWIWMCHDLANNPPWHHRNSMLACYSTTMAITYRSTLILMLVEYMYYVYMQRYRVGFGRTESTLVRIGVCLNMNVSILDGRCTMTPSQLQTHCYSNTLQRRWRTALRWCWLNTYCIMKRYRVGFGRTACTLVLVRVLVWICRDLAYNPPWQHRNFNGIVLALNALACFSNTLCIHMYIIMKYHVGFGRTVGTLLLVHVLIRICRDLAYNPP